MQSTITVEGQRRSKVLRSAVACFDLAFPPAVQVVCPWRHDAPSVCVALRIEAGAI